MTLDLFVEHTADVHLTAGEIAALIDGRTVEFETCGITLQITGEVPDWSAR